MIRRSLEAENPNRLRLRTSIKRSTRVAIAQLNTEASDMTLVSGLRSGNESAIASLYDRYSSIVYSVALRVLGDTGAAEDVLQEVFLQLWRNPASFDSARGNMGPWLSVIARNRAIDALRKRRPETDIDDVVVTAPVNLAEEAERAQAAGKVRAALAGMPEAQRKALELAYFEGMTHTEIAQKTGEPLGTIKTRIRAGLMALRKVVTA